MNCHMHVFYTLQLVGHAHCNMARSANSDFAITPKHSPTAVSQSAFEAGREAGRAIRASFKPEQQFVKEKSRF